MKTKLILLALLVSTLQSTAFAGGGPIEINNIYIDSHNVAHIGWECGWVIPTQDDNYFVNERKLFSEIESFGCNSSNTAVEIGDQVLVGGHMHFASTQDSGKTITPVTFTHTHEHDSFAEFVMDQSVLFAVTYKSGTHPYGLSVSTDQGKTFQASQEWVGEIHSLKVVSGVAYFLHHAWGPRTSQMLSLVVSKDLGRTFQTLFTVPEDYYSYEPKPISYAVSNNVLYVGKPNGEIVISKNHGESFELLGTLGTPVEIINVIDGIIYANRLPPEKEEVSQGNFYSGLAVINTNHGFSPSYTFSSRLTDVQKHNGTLYLVTHDGLIISSNGKNFKRIIGESQHWRPWDGFIRFRGDVTYVTDGLQVWTTSDNWKHLRKLGQPFDYSRDDYY